jgi:hypothetical protein
VELNQPDKRWSVRRWVTTLTLILGAQLGFIYWLGESRLPPERPPWPAPLLRIAGDKVTRFLALNDPTLFALPHRQGFAGLAWLETPPLAQRSFDWTEPPRWLELPVASLGQMFDQFIATNRLDFAQSAGVPVPELVAPQLKAPAPLRASSSMRVEGALAARRLLTKPELPSWINAAPLTNTVLGVVVNAAGQAVSVTTLARCGVVEADQFAFAVANSMRFESVQKSGPGVVANPLDALTWGQMIFEWKTLPDKKAK